MTIIVQLFVILGGAWCGAVLSQVFFHGELTRLSALLAGAPAVVAWFIGLGEPTRRRVRLQFGFTLAWLGVLLSCAALATTELVQLSEEGRWRRALAVLSFVATLIELRRLSLAQKAPAAEQGSVVPYLTTLPFESLGVALASRAEERGVALETLVGQLERAIAAAAPGHFHSNRRFEAKYDPERQTVGLSLVVEVENGDEHVYEVAWQLEAQSQARANDTAHAKEVGFASANSGFEVVVDRLTREVLGLPAQGPIDELRDDWLRVLNALLFSTHEQKRHLEVVVRPDALPRPVGGLTVIDLTLEGPKFFECRGTPRELTTEWVVAGQPLQVGTVGWAEIPVSVLGSPDLEALEGWVQKWMQPAVDSDGTKLSGVVHRVEVMHFTTGVELTIDFGSAPVRALEELVVLLRKSGPVSLDHAALDALARRPHEGTRADIVPLVRREGGSVSEHLVGDLWLTYAVESRQSFAGISPHEAQALGPELRSLAIENLRQRIPPVRITGHSGLYALALPGEGGFFEASLLLLDEVWTEQLAPLLKGDPVVCIPFRDLVFVTGNDDQAGLERLSSLVAGTQQQNLEHPLSTQVLVRHEGHWRVR